MSDSKEKPKFPGPQGFLPNERPETPRFVFVGDSLTADKGAILRNRDPIDRERNKDLLEATIVACEAVLEDKRASNVSPTLYEDLVAFSRYLPADATSENVLLTEVTARRLRSRLNETINELQKTGYEAQAQSIQSILELHAARMSLHPEIESFRQQTEAARLEVHDVQIVAESVEKISDSLAELADLIDVSVVETFRDYSTTETDESNWRETTMGRLRLTENLVIALAKEVLRGRQSSVTGSWISEMALRNILKVGAERLGRAYYFSAGWITKVGSFLGF